ncbi:hypothetical protein MKZ38_010439 [Zalerion maritima]|uniref:Clr5 domain-containing protein n=1 Tax=Zalerion maritima TaxID=339359 RepID=A0AAD5RSH1_9PEZI|nr:hypothetical protein MKZ38_010439 [Zalerion maritima]
MFDWTGYEKLIRRLYLEEKRSLEEVSDFLRVHHNFQPSKRTLQHKFQQWGFPRKHTIDKDDPKLQERIRELWAKNLGHGEILQVLVDVDGYDISDKDLARLRKKNKLLIRVGRPGQPKAVRKGADKYLKENDRGSKIVDGHGDLSDDSLCSNVTSDSGDEEEDGVSTGQIDSGSTSNQLGGLVETESSPVADEDLSPGALAKRVERKRQLERESAELWAAKKRRRRIKPRGGLPADPPQPPRFPSELTLEESKIFLELEDGNQYNEIRDRFQRVCEENDVVKKTIAGPEKWEILKDQLIRETAHLEARLWEPGAAKDSLDQRKLSLDIICMDVTKRMRAAGRRLTVGEAKNILGWNPEVGRDMKEKFQEILRKDHYFSIVETGEKRWKELRQEWIGQNPVIQACLDPPGGPGKHSPQESARAVDFLARDAAKRYKNDITRKHPTQMEAPKTFALVHGGEKISAKDASTERAKQLREAVKDPSALATAMHSRPVPHLVPTTPSLPDSSPPSATCTSPSSAVSTSRCHTIGQVEAVQPERQPQGIQPNTRSQGQPQQIQPLPTQRQTRSHSHSQLVSNQAPLLSAESDLSIESQLGLLTGQQPTPQSYMTQSTLSAHQQPSHQTQAQVQAQAQFLDLSLQPIPPMSGMSPMQMQQAQFAPPMPPTPMYRPQPPTDMAVFIRQAQTSGFGSQMNIATLSAGAGVGGIRNEAVTLSAVQGAMCDSVQGIVKGKNGAQELGIEIRSDEELGAYLGHVSRSEGGAPMFDVRLRWGAG